jgi:hypothetical protein
VRERDESRHLAVGAGAPSDPDEDGTDGDDVVVEDRAPTRPNGRNENGDGDDTAGVTQTAGDVVRAVAEFLDDLVDDPTFAHDPRPAREP